MIRILTGNVFDILPTLPDRSVQTCITSPAYWGLRDYGTAGQLGMEKTPQEYVANLVAVFREVRRVLRDDGVLWLNLGDSYAGGGQGNYGNPIAAQHGQHPTNVKNRPGWLATTGLKPKDLVGIPWRVAFALQDDGWWLRSDIIWSKPNPMPESVTDRPTKAHEYIFLLAKSKRYYWDAEAVKEPLVSSDEVYLRAGKSVRENHAYGSVAGRPLGDKSFATVPTGRNLRTVWTIATHPYSGAHFATFPPALVEPMVKASTREGDTVLDPFGGAGTTGLVASRLGRDAVLIELNPEYAEMARKRIYEDAPLFA